MFSHTCGVLEIRIHALVGLSELARRCSRAVINILQSYDQVLAIYSCMVLLRLRLSIFISKFVNYIDTVSYMRLPRTLSEYPVG